MTDKSLTLDYVGEFMTPEEWAEIPDNPKQRDTAARAVRASRQHLKNFAAPQANVSAARLPDGTTYKLDGHTRSYLWMNSKLEAPASLRVDVYNVETLDEIMSLYDMFDNPQAAESATDRLTGAYRFYKITPKSRLLTQGGVTSALRILTGHTGGGTNFNILTSVKNWKKELEAIDKCDLPPEKITTGLLVAALLGVRLIGEDTLLFWERFAAGLGERANGASDAVDMLLRTMEKRRASRTLSGSSNHRDIAGKAFAAMEAWKAGRFYTQHIKGVDVSILLSRAKKTLKQS